MENKNITGRLLEMADRWHNADRDVFRVCRDAAEEVRVLQTQIEGMKREIAVYQSWSSPRFWPETGYHTQYKDPTSSLGWGKGKDE